MKKYTLILIASLLSTMAFAQILPDSVTGGASMSGEVGLVLNSASTMSSEININLPFDPSEVENMPSYNSAGDYEFPPYSLNSATYVKAGPESIIFFIIAIILGTAIYTYRVRTQKEQ